MKTFSREEIEAAIDKANKELQRSERGRDVHAQLLTLLEGPISSLDAEHWHSVMVLINFYRAGWQGTVLDTMRESEVSHG